MRRLVIIIATVGLVAAGCGGSSPDPAAVALERQIGYQTKGQWGRAWDELHPADQALVSRDAYIACRSSAVLSGLTVDKVVEVYDETFAIAGTGLSGVPSRAVTMQLSLGNAHQTITMHEVNVGGSWRWTMSDPTPCESGS